MMRKCGLLACLAAGLLCTAVLAGGQGVGNRDSLADYLTPDGKLTSPLEVRDEKTGFGTFAGKIYRIEPDGKWTITEIFRRQPYPRGQGILDKGEVRKLAKVLAEHDVLSLPNIGRPKVNPHVVTITFGPTQAVLTFGVDQVLVPPDPGDASGLARYSGIANAVKGLLAH